MFLLLAHDYAKLWKAENVAVTVKRFESVGEADEHLCRRYVLRALYKKQRLEEEDKPRFIMKRFRNIPSKVKQFMGFPNMPKEKLENEEPDEEFDNIFPSAADSNEVLRAKLANSLIKDDCVSIPDCNVLTAAISPREIKQKEEKCRVSSSVARTNLVD